MTHPNLLDSPTPRFSVLGLGSWAPTLFEGFLQKEMWGAQCLGLSAAGGRGANSADPPVPVGARLLQPVRAEQGPPGCLSACNPNSSQGPSASNKPSQLQRQARKPEEYSPAHVMINWQQGGPGGQGDNEKVSLSYLKCRGPGEGPRLAPDSWANDSCPLQGVLISRTKHWASLWEQGN